MENKKYICHSGGCSGSDMEWEIQGREYNIPTIAYSFNGHIQEGKYAKILTEDELLEGWKHVQLVEKSIKRPLYKIKQGETVIYYGRRTTKVIWKTTDELEKQD